MSNSGAPRPNLGLSSVLLHAAHGTATAMMTPAQRGHMRDVLGARRHSIRHNTKWKQDRICISPIRCSYLKTFAIPPSFRRTSDTTRASLRLSFKITERQNYAARDDPTSAPHLVRPWPCPVGLKRRKCSFQIRLACCRYALSSAWCDVITRTVIVYPARARFPIIHAAGQYPGFEGFPGSCTCKDRCQYLLTNRFGFT
jgi:hypothetical protein|eukprot:COSAG02_NODE_9626_length_2157_cov_1.598154_3_plen_199_part_00